LSRAVVPDRLTLGGAMLPVRRAVSSRGSVSGTAEKGRFSACVLGKESGLAS